MVYVVLVNLLVYQIAQELRSGERWSAFYLGMLLLFLIIEAYTGNLYEVLK